MKTSYRISLSYFKFEFLINALVLICFAPSAYADITMMGKLLKQQPQLEAFDICFGGGCALQAHASIDPSEWERVQDVFTPQPSNAEEERSAISLAIGAFEDIVGHKTGTAGDRAGTFGNSQYPGQMDCNDEATNSNTYLKLLIEMGLINHHKLIDTKTRHFFFNGWPHTTAVIEDIDAKQKYVVDSWFYDNGLPAEVMTLEQWLDGWKPIKTTAH